MADLRLEPLVLSEDERRILENWAKRRSTAQGLALQARIVLTSAEGGSNLAVTARLGVTAARLPSGWPGSWRADWTDWATSRAQWCRAQSAMSKWMR